MNLDSILDLDRPCPRSWYALVAAVLIDWPLEGEVSGHVWALTCGFALFLMYMTARRFTDIGWSRWWAVPYALFTLSPYLVLFFVPHADVRLITLGNILLQVPAMVWPKKTAVPMAVAQ